MQKFLGIFQLLDLSNKNVSIEVVTIYDCFNGENASDFKETILVLNKENFTKQGSRDLIHVELMAKCLKWRLVLVENNQTKVSDWSYFSFQNNQIMKLLYKIIFLLSISLTFCAIT